MREFMGRILRPRRAARRRMIERIRDAIVADMPEQRTSLSVGTDRGSGPGGCPRVEISILPRGEAGAAVEAWAQRSVDRYGEDRVVVRRWHGAHLESRRGQAGPPPSPISLPSASR